MELTQDPQFLSKNRNMSVDALVAILQRYQSTKGKSSYPQLSDSNLKVLLQRFMPQCTNEALRAAVGKK
jgi:hypothetical protein